MNAEEPPDPSPDDSPGDGAAPVRRNTERKKVLVRLDPAVHDAIARWARDDLRSTNAQIEFALRRALDQAGRLPKSR